MAVRYAKSYIDQLYESKNVFALHGVITVVAKDRELPEQFWLFCKLWEWRCSTRSGIWQYYEGIAVADFKKIATALERFELFKLSEKYRSGMTTWKKPDGCTELDDWIDKHSCELENAAFELIANNRDCLYDDNN
jgi:hypothetical protein